MYKEKREVKIAGIQMSCEVGNKDSNVQKALKLIDKAAKDEADIILLQELFSTDYVSFCRRVGTKVKTADTKVFQYAEPIPGPTTNIIAEKAKEHGVFIIAPIFEKAAPGVYYNTAPLIGPTGEVIGKYRKTHIPAIKGLEKLYFRPGSQYQVFKTELGNLGVLICADGSFAENWRIVSLMGAEIIFLPYANTGEKSDIDMWECTNRTKASDNRVFAVLVNRVGKEEMEVEMNFWGNSMIVNPKGDVLAKAGEEDEIVSATIDLDEVDRSRIGWTIFRDLRPELYGRLTRPP